jgi:hypothetical protein
LLLLQLAEAVEAGVVAEAEAETKVDQVVEQTLNLA